MTSQVAVFNLEGVAVASDSIRTLTRGGMRRTFDTGEKLFDLGVGHRVVMLTSGSASLMRVPMSVLIEGFRASLTEPFGSLADYATAFLAWLGSRVELSDAAAQDAHFGWQLRDYYGMVRSDVMDAIAHGGPADEPWDSPSVIATVTRTVDSLVDALKNRDDLQGINNRQDENYLDAHRELIEFSYIDQVEGMPRTVAADWRLTQELPRLILQKAESWARDCVVAFIGFGTDDPFPRQSTLTIHGVVNDQVRAELREEARISVANSACVSSFGQDDAIRTFLNGHRGELHSEGGLDDIGPVLEAIELLPRSELAGVAEALVGVQALSAALTCQQPTVGGPIDVVLVTRSHGVQWLRRKY